MRTCPYCAEDIQDAAIKCKHCHSMIGNGNEPANRVWGVATNKASIHLDRRWGWPMITAGGLCITAVAFMLNEHWALSVIVLAAMIVPGWLAFVRTFACAFCERRLHTAIVSENRRCPRCEVLHVITWEDGSGSAT